MPDLSTTRNPTKTISQNEWDFSTCPKDEMDYCRFYEFARYNDELKAEIARRRTDDNWRSGLSPEDWAFYGMRAKLGFFRLFPEFPDRPWLEIKEGDRRKRCAECRILDGPFVVVAPDRLDPADGYPCVPTDVGTRTIHHVYAVEIDLTASREAIKQSFERWIDSVHQNREIVVKKQGGLTDADLLKALGAYRLLAHFEGKWKEAADWSQKNRRDNEPLYSDQPEWIKARKKADKFISAGVAPSPAAVVLARLDLSKLERPERAAVKVHLAMKVDRAEARRLGKLKADKALTEILAAVALAHKNPV